MVSDLSAELELAEARKTIRMGADYLRWLKGEPPYEPLSIWQVLLGARSPFPPMPVSAGMVRHAEEIVARHLGVAVANG